MLNEFCRVPVFKATEALSSCAMGRIPADTVIRNARLVNVCTGEILDHTDVAVILGRIALVGDASGCIGDNTRVIDASGAFLAPGFLDGHIHVESSMLSVGEYARAVIPHGTVGIYMDPHEICNVLGAQGVRLMMEDSLRTPLKTMVTVPSCVPAVPGFEDSGAAIHPEDIREMLGWERVVGLGEVMNYAGVQESDREVHAKMAQALRADKVVTGHYAAPGSGPGLNAYIAAGARCCHESTRAEDALAKMRLGMYAQIREGSAWRDLHETAKAITQGKVDTRFANLVTDDAHPHTLSSSGHLDHVLRRAMEEGIDPVTAIQMVTINCAACFRMDQELGSLTPGKCADMVLLESLETVRVTHVWIDGELVAQNGQLLSELRPFAYPAWAVHSMHVGEPIVPGTFRIPSPVNTDSIRARVIEIIPEKVGNYERIVSLPVKNGAVEAVPEQDIMKAFVFERHKGTGLHGCGFVKGFGIPCGAMAQTVSHDAHNLLVVGTNDRDMSTAANTLLDCGGGLCAVRDGRVLGLVPLPIAGLMSDRSAAEMSELVAELERAWAEIGCRCASPFMTMALLSLACLPELRLTNRGLVDCRTFTFTDLFLED
jgi:adenine deaminase